MTYKQVIEKFLKKVAAIKKEKPTYRQPGDGSDGTCDCIGLVIGAIRRMGLKWTGIHGSNWAARKEVVTLEKITNVNSLAVGEVVFKAKEKGETGWKLPSRYQKGGAYYDGDLRDYYHVGVVTSVNPLNITHMTSPTVRVDTSLGKWGYHGTLKILVKAVTSTGSDTIEPVQPVQDNPPINNQDSSTGGTNTMVPATGVKALVWAPSGRYVKMRQKPSTKCKLYEEIPVGATVTLEAPGEEWAKISYGRRKNWYMMAKYLFTVKEE